MPKQDPTMLLDGDVLALTAKGRKELQSSGTHLAPAQLEVLVLLDGKSTLGQTAARVRMRGKPEVFELCAQMMAEGLVEIAHDKGASLDFVDFFRPREPMIPSAAALASAKEEAAATTLLLQKKGYSARIARRPDTPGRAPESGRLSVLVIEDEPHLGKVLKHVLAGEGMDTRLATRKEEIVAEIRRPPVPDLVILDVVLPDVDGFDVLERMREHPALRTVPVIMLTAESTRDAVLRGLLLGADGYVTKPFEIEVLLQAVAAVLGLPDVSRESSGAWGQGRPR
jgi:CheY-like chemotaxis protein